MLGDGGAASGACGERGSWEMVLHGAEAASERVGGPTAAGARTLAPRAPGVPQGVAVLF